MENGSKNGSKRWKTVDEEVRINGRLYITTSALPKNAELPQKLEILPKNSLGHFISWNNQFSDDRCDDDSDCHCYAKTQPEMAP
jgi:hypothetical protein